MKLQMSFGENLINLRKQKGWSQDDLANNLNLSRQAISKWENDTSKPDIDNIEKISKIFSVTIDDLLNNDVVKDKAVTLNVKKQEKKEKTITIIKCMIIAVIILYIINVIFKFASLLIIVNGIQKYANLSNYHYVITTYDENGLVEKEECWFKDGVSKTETKVYNNDKTNEIVISINYNENYGYMKNKTLNKYSELNVQEYIKSHSNYENGAQLYSKIPINKRKINVLFESFDIKNLKISFENNKICLKNDTNYLILHKNTLLPIFVYKSYKQQNDINYYFYQIDIGNVENIKI